MKREGRQHGMVRTYRVLPSPWNPRPEPRFVQQVNSPTTAGLFTKVPVEPTNHSKFTGRCGRPRCLGCHMHPAFKSKDKAKGFSAARMLDHLSSDYEGYDNDDDDDQCHVVNDGLKASSQSQEEVENHEGKTEDDDEKHEGVDVDDMKFVLDRELEEEGWCLVGEI
ncbi:hypothetical protein ES288_A05G381000v1 [Gossypium darwinii]|uniref:Uncharacterized protein n=2 Tax=Gossypium TaxID=3633 RepID=A0A5D2QPS7_GOSTO|nr:hypothetical protein ES288_A05G381000v1 [Gossypium darwinii]TYI30409.1 hypothetical protein ES332_A05G385400v1 [Gossypium tomentosum]